MVSNYTNIRINNTIDHIWVLSHPLTSGIHESKHTCAEGRHFKHVVCYL